MNIKELNINIRVCNSNMNIKELNVNIRVASSSSINIIGQYKHQGFQSIKYEYRDTEYKHKGFQSVTYNDKRSWLSTDSKRLQFTKHRYKDCEQKERFKPIKHEYTFATTFSL